MVFVNAKIQNYYDIRAKNGQQILHNYYKSAAFSRQLLPYSTETHGVAMGYDLLRFQRVPFRIEPLCNKLNQIRVRFIELNQGIKCELNH